MLNSSVYKFNVDPFPEVESNGTAYEKCVNEKTAKLHCPKRWQALQKYWDHARMVGICFYVCYDVAGVTNSQTIFPVFLRSWVCWYRRLFLYSISTDKTSQFQCAPSKWYPGSIPRLQLKLTWPLTVRALSPQCSLRHFSSKTSERATIFGRWPHMKLFQDITPRCVSSSWNIWDT